MENSIMETPSSTSSPWQPASAVSKSSNSTMSSPTTASTGIGIPPLSSGTILTKEMARLPYACNQCGKTFRTGPYLHQHQKFVHSDNRPFECTLCKRGFKRKSDLSNHMKRLHDKTSSTNVVTAGPGVIKNAQNVILQDITFGEKVACLLPLCPYCPTLPPPPDSSRDDVEYLGMSSSSQKSLSLNDASNSSILTTSSSTQTPAAVVLRPPSPIPCSSSSVENKGSMIGSGSEARTEEVPFKGLLRCAKTSGKAVTEEDLDGDIVVLYESVVARFETVETENHVEDHNEEDISDPEAEVGLNHENNSINSTTPSPGPAPAKPSSSSPVPCSSSSLESGGSIVADKDRVEEPNQGSCTGAGGMLENQGDDDQQGGDVVEAEGVPVVREIDVEIRDENVDVAESEESDDDDIYNPDDFFGDDNWFPPELTQAPDELSEEPILTHTYHHNGYTDR